ncbi:MAG: hypothetical protein JWO36_1801 [Myxococcales bacterium]|nr:hypothetical protein [Myxococcales bacterium]
MERSAYAREAGGGSYLVVPALLDLLQWPAMIVTAIAAWLVASRSARKRTFGFWFFIASNVLWVIWGLHDHAFALIGLQLCLAALNIRGVYKNDQGDRRPTHRESAISGRP